MDLQSIDYMGLLSTSFKRVSSNDGDEFHGACPFCGGSDRFFVHPTPRNGNPRASCRQCGFNGDAIAFVMRRDGSDFKAALATLGLSGDGLMRRQRTERKPPALQPLPTVDMERECFNPHWQQQARKFVDGAKAYLWSEKGAPALDYLRKRGFTDTQLEAHEIGFNPIERDPKPRWGNANVWLPMGIIIGWTIDNQLWNVRTRRLNPDFTSYKGDGKYINSTGMANGIWNIDRVTPGCIVVMTEGELNALSVELAARAYGLPIAAIAAGSTTNGRRQRWVIRLLRARRVYVAFDQDENGAGENASKYWLKELGDTAARLRPPQGLNDVNDLLQTAGVEGVANWLMSSCSELTPRPQLVRECHRKPAAFQNVTTRELARILGTQGQ